MPTPMSKSLKSSKSLKLSRYQLKVIRNQLGLDAQGMAALMGVHYQSIYKWESGDMPISEQRSEEILNIFFEYIQTISLLKYDRSNGGHDFRELIISLCPKPLMNYFCSLDERKAEAYLDEYVDAVEGLKLFLEMYLHWAKIYFSITEDELVDSVLSRVKNEVDNLYSQINEVVNES